MVCVLLLAAAIRLWDLKTQSTWGDDYILLGFLDAPDWFTFRAETRSFNPDMPGLFYALAYAWSRVAGHAPESMRLLPVCLGTAGVAMVYFAGRAPLGKRASLIAALCMALSPLHIYHSQGMRGYALVVLLGLISAITCLRMLQGNRWRWWAANSVVNAAMLWTHLTAGLLIVTWTAAILLWQRRRRAMWMAWLALPTASALPLLNLFGHVVGPAGDVQAARPGLWETITRPLAWTLDREAAYLLAAWPRAEYFQDHSRPIGWP